MNLVSVKGKVVVIDSCILLYCEGEIFKDHFRKLLRHLTDNGNELVMSNFSGFEVLKNAKEKDKQYFIRLMNFIPNIEINKNILTNSSNLFKAYKKVIKDKSRLQTISVGDLIIGSTAVLVENSYLLTANRKDFPAPIWKLVARDFVNYDREDETRTLNYYLLEFRQNEYDKVVKSKS